VTICIVDNLRCLSVFRHLVLIFLALGAQNWYWRLMKFRDFIRVLEAHGFVLDRQRGSHRTYKGVVAGKMRVVIVACHRESDDIKSGTLSSMIRNSGLSKRLFRAEALKRPTA
jgi:predicted RNA binding protein YcfA (HicA-like mRNA interferase family)